MNRMKENGAKCILANNMNVLLTAVCYRATLGAPESVWDGARIRAGKETYQGESKANHLNIK